jgi:predicted dehydrogenase
MKSATQQVNVDLLGSEGRIHVNDQGAVFVKQTPSGLSTTPLRAQGTLGGIQAAFVDLLTAIETGREVQSPPREARKTVALIEAILASQAGGNTRVAVDSGA